MAVPVDVVAAKQRSTIVAAVTDHGEAITVAIAAAGGAVAAKLFPVSAPLILVPLMQDLEQKSTYRKLAIEETAGLPEVALRTWFCIKPSPYETLWDGTVWMGPLVL